MPKVRVLPAGVDLEVREGEAVAEAAWRQGYVWPTQCWGQADCMSCFTRIVDGELCAVPAEELELDAVRLKMAGRMRNDPLIRLACQLRCRGEGLVLEKKGFRPAEERDHNMAGEPVESGRA
ncbi:2Fe-2S iron-sulfur cluster binding domain-containing protein [Nakamurella sp. YIM 132087]|uniref:2Fe-2S iron-sulfur cluster binding domain-containing protein n=1 Tax=Nakamurella alba TaxID=2665158 RepID=A0A7K1FQW6_9ACTN|nr:2Fe-2S iron-sulfur cluster-binding protein [Nakamurella alba]MTD15184.1 2Fe-2S iron-sulfur cluster binding domain-containing protein [Nakamurella alba]